MITGAAVKAGLAGAQMLAGVGKKIGAAVKEKKANRLDDKASNIAESSARQQLANAGNPMGNAAAQSVIGEMNKEFDAQASQNAAMNAMGGATQEMALAQNKQRAQGISDSFSALAKQASDNYANAQNNLYNVQSQNVYKQAERMHNAADQLSQSADNDIKSGIGGLSESADTLATGMNKIKSKFGNQ